MFTRNLTKTTIALILLSLLTLAVPAQANGCSYKADYIGGGAYAFHCPGASTATVTVNDAVGQPAVRVCDANNACFVGCGAFSVNGEFVSVEILAVYVDPATLQTCFGTAGQLVVAFS